VGEVHELSIKIEEAIDMPQGWVFSVPVRFAPQLEQIEPRALLPSLLLAALDFDSVVLTIDGETQDYDSVAYQGLLRYEHHIKEGGCEGCRPAS